jgi:hypothetical protein
MKYVMRNLFWIAVLFSFTTSLCAAEFTPDSSSDLKSSTSAVSQPAKKVAIYIANRLGDELNKQMPVFEDSLASKLANKGFALISREIVISAVGDLESKRVKNKLDRALDEQTSALRLAQNLGADYILFATIMDYSNEVRDVNAYGVEFKNYDYSLAASYRILSGATGETLIADMAQAQRTIQQTKHNQVKGTNVVGELIIEVATDLANQLIAKEESGDIRKVSLASDLVQMDIGVSMADLNFPEVIFENDGSARITANKAVVQALAVTVELDGIAIGTTGAGSGLSSFRVSPGIHRMRLSREDFVPWERNVNIYDGLKINVSMALTPEGLVKWRESTAIYNQMKSGAILDRAEAELLRGMAKMLEKSGLSIDIQDRTHSEIHVDTKEALEIHTDRIINNN